MIPLLVGGTRNQRLPRRLPRRGADRDRRQRRRALVGFAAGSFRVGDLAGAATAAVTSDVRRASSRIGDATVFGPRRPLDDAASVPVRIADRTWMLTVKDPGGPGLSLPVALAVMGISLAALLASLILTWGRTERMQELERQASQDALTGLSNRRRFEEDLRSGDGAQPARPARPGRC